MVHVKRYEAGLQKEAGLHLSEIFTLIAVLDYGKNGKILKYSIYW